jgi:hypothetical protein
MSNPSSVERGGHAEFDASVSLPSNAGNRVQKPEGRGRIAQHLEGERTIPDAYDVARGAEPPRRNKFVDSPRWRSAMNAGLYDGPRWDGTSLRKQRFLRIQGGKQMARYSKSASKDVKGAMERRKAGTLKSGKSGETVKSKKQAIAIGLSEARAKGKKAPSKKSA